MYLEIGRMDDLHQYNDSKARLFLGLDHDIALHRRNKFEQIIVDMKITDP